MIVLLIKIVIEEYINHITPYHFKLLADPAPFAQRALVPARTGWRSSSTCSTAGTACSRRRSASAASDCRSWNTMFNTDAV